MARGIAKRCCILPISAVGAVRHHGVPAIVVPVGSGAHGLPLSVQVVGPYGGDHLTLSAALALEQLLGGWLRPAIQATKSRCLLRSYSGY
ncbi:MAG: hypothetical protein LBJ65_03560 [Burkholderia sp.]|nr:hypothetical protein [Burkholderia sp.]